MPTNFGGNLLCGGHLLQEPIQLIAIDDRKSNQSINKITVFFILIGIELLITSIQGTQNLAPEKCSYNLCIHYLYYMKGRLYSGERDTFSGSRSPLLNSIQGTP